MVDITRRDHSKKFSLATTAVHDFVLREFKGKVLEVADFDFHAGSAVMLPDHGRRDPDPKVLPVTALSALATALKHAKDNASHKLWVTGHDADAALSLARAQSVTAVLRGDRDGWVAAVRERHNARDVQRVLTWVSEVWAFDCDPGGVDGSVGRGTRRAITAFKKGYNKEFSKSLAEDAEVNDDLWGAFFDVYQEVLGVFLGGEGADAVAPFRAALKFVEDGKRAVGCAGNHGLESVRQGAFRGGATRVELCFYEPGDVPLTECHPTPEQCLAQKCEVYNPVMFRWEAIPPAPVVKMPKLRVKLELGDIDKLFAEIKKEDISDAGVRQRLQAIGFFYASLKEKGVNTLAADAWAHFKSENNHASDAAAVADLKAKVKSVIVDGGAIPAKGAFKKLRVPGTWCVTPGIGYGFFGTAANGHRYREEKRVWGKNAGLGRVPVLAKLEVLRKGWKPAGGQKVHFKLVEPDALPAAEASEPLRAATFTSVTPNDHAPPPTVTFTMTGHPKQYVDNIKALDPAVAGDPQVDNAHKNRGGKRGNAVAGSDRDANVLERGVRHKSFHDALDLKVAKRSRHPNAVSVETNAKGEAAAILMPAWTGGDRYRLMAFVDPVGPQASDGTEDFAVKEETGTFVVWRILRVSKYLRWAYPAGSTAAQQSNCGGALDDFDFAGVISTEFKRAWFDVTLEKDAATRHDITQAEWLSAIQWAKSRAKPSTSRRYDLATLLPESSGGVNNDNAAVLNFLTKAQYAAAPKSAPAPAGGWPAPPANNTTYWNDMSEIFHTVKDEFVHFFSKNATSGVVVLQAGAVSSHLSDAHAGAPSTPFGNSGWGTYYRACWVIFGRNVYTNPSFPYDHTRNCLHEVGHVLFGSHQYTDTAQANVSTGNNFDAHDYKDLCIMGYMKCAGDFCGRCVLNRAGWDTSKTAPNPPGP